MGYSGVKDGMDAILAAERLVRRKREQAPWVSADQIIVMFRLAVDRAMGEAGLPAAGSRRRAAPGHP